MGSRRRDDSAEFARKLRTDTDALREAEIWVRRNIYGLSDEEARWLYDRYKVARMNILAGMSDAWTSDGLNPPQRLMLFDMIEREMQALMPDVFRHLLDTSERATLQGYYGHAWALEMGTNEDVRIRVPVLPSEAIRAMLLQPYLGQQWGENLLMSRDEFVLKIKRDLTTAMINGEGIQKAAARLDQSLGVKPDRKKGFQGHFYRTVLIARTEIMRASNLGALAIYEQNRDILRGWEWVATRDERTCKICGALDGKVFKFGDPQLAPPSGSHPGCRCTAVPVLIDTALMDEVMGGPRKTYAEWAAENGITIDGGLADQRGSQPHGLNTTGGRT